MFKEILEEFCDTPIIIEKIIEFSAPQLYLDLKDKETYPAPAKLNLPEWYKKLEHTPPNRTVKGCMPFLDTLISGYILKMPIDFYIEHNVKKKDSEEKDCTQYAGTFDFSEYYSKSLININYKAEFHSPYQLEGSPLINKNSSLAIHKIINPWKIKTPKGYSCLFVPLLNNTDDRFSIIPGIVDTDVFEQEINFPIIINGDKYPVLETTIKKGTPYVQIIPFKRDSWKMKIKPHEIKDKINNTLKYGLNFFRKYQNNFWIKKSWK
jgi:hypothetical protein